MTYNKLKAIDAPFVREAVEKNGTMTLLPNGKSFTYNPNWSDESVAQLLSLKIPYLKASHVRNLRAAEYPATPSAKRPGAPASLVLERFNALCDHLYQRSDDNRFVDLKIEAGEF